jgi:hypothetical protein
VIDDRKQRGVGADADRQRQCGRYGEGPVFPEQSYSEEQVTHEVTVPIRFESVTTARPEFGDD